MHGVAPSVRAVESHGQLVITMMMMMLNSEQWELYTMLGLIRHRALQCASPEQCALSRQTAPHSRVRRRATLTPARDGLAWASRPAVAIHSVFGNCVKQFVSRLFRFVGGQSNRVPSCLFNFARARACAAVDRKAVARTAWPSRTELHAEIVVCKTPLTCYRLSMKHWWVYATSQRMMVSLLVWPQLSVNDVLWPLTDDCRKYRTPCDLAKTTDSFIAYRVSAKLSVNVTGFTSEFLLSEAIVSWTYAQWRMPEFIVLLTPASVFSCHNIPS